jgi:hypothetical protein
MEIHTAIAINLETEFTSLSMVSAETDTALGAHLITRAAHAYGQSIDGGVGKRRARLN